MHNPSSVWDLVHLYLSSCFFCLWVFGPQPKYGVEKSLLWLPASPVNQVTTVISLLCRVSPTLMFNLSSICSSVQLKQMSINNLMTGRQMSRMGKLSVLANSQHYSIFQPSNYWIEDEAELVTSYWRILIAGAVWQQSLFSLPKSGSVCEKILSQNRQKGFVDGRGRRPE